MAATWLPSMTMTTEVSTPATTSSADAALLILRLGLGATMLQAGLIKAFDPLHSSAGVSPEPTPQ